MRDNVVANDPVVRYGALAIIALLSAALTVVIIHGYWGDPHYVIPDALVFMLASIVTAMFTLLGVHSGSASAAVGSASTLSAVKETTTITGTNGTNGTVSGNTPTAPHG
jgi:hypothetical protein